MFEAHTVLLLFRFFFLFYVILLNIVIRKIIQVPFVSGKFIKELSVGLSHALALTQDQMVYVWGKTDFTNPENPERNLIETPTVLNHFNSMKIVGIACSLTQVFISMA